MGQPVRDRSLRSARSALYGGAAIFLAAVFVTLLWDPLRWATVELDLWWMLGAISSLVEGKSAWELAGFVLAPTPPALEPPVVKLFLLLVSPGVGLQIRHLVLIALGVHCANAVLLYRVLRQMGLGFREGFVAACFYLTVLAHFHAFLWPTAFQHLLAVSTILLVLHFYLKTEERIRLRQPGWGSAYAATLAVGLLASLQRSALIGVGLILTDIFLCSRVYPERILRYRRWLPLFVVCLFYPVWVLALGVDGILTGMVLHSGLPEQVKDFFLPAGATQNPTSLGLKKYPILFGAGAAALLGLGALLQAASRWRSGKIFLLVAGLLGAAGFALSWFQDKRQLLFLYNALVPFVATLFSFLQPIETALRMGVPEATHHYIPPQIGPLSVGISLLFLAWFWAGFVKRNRRLLLLLVWYLLCLLFLLRHQYAAFPSISPSRYFIFLSPTVAAVFGSVAILLWDKLARSAGQRSRAGEVTLIALFGILCLANLVGIRLASWKGRLPNTFYAYDDIRLAHLISEDLGPPRKSDRVEPASLEVWVDGVEPMMPMQRIGGIQYPWVDPARHDNLRIALMEKMGRRRISRLEVNEAQNGSGHDADAAGVPKRYTVRRSRLLDRQGHRIDRFGQLLEEGLAEMSAGRPERAVEALERAARRRPFLLQYCLGPALRLEDIRWLTGGQGLREWLRRVTADWRTSSPKFDAIRSTMEEELSGYALCLYSLSALEEEQGHAGRSGYWLSQIRWVEEDPQVLRDWLGRQPDLLARPLLRQHLDRLDDPSTFSDPLPWRKDDYGFGRFILRFLFGLDFRSESDRRFNTL